METKICKGCKKEKSIIDFYSVKKPSFTRVAQCKVCHVARQIKNRNKNPIRRDANSLRAKYGIDIVDFVHMFSRQDGKCKICECIIETKTLKGKANRACIDHCHVTGRVRGLLCANCNWALGLLQDKPEVFKKAAEYLEFSYT